MWNWAQRKRTQRAAREWVEFLRVSGDGSAPLLDPSPRSEAASAAVSAAAIT